MIPCILASAFLGMVVHRLSYDAGSGKLWAIILLTISVATGLTLLLDIAAMPYAWFAFVMSAVVFSEFELPDRFFRSPSSIVKGDDG